MNLAATMFAQRPAKLQDARQLQREVVDARMTVLGADHPDTLVAKSALAATLHAADNFKEASRLQTEIVESMDRVLGMNHPDTVRTRTNLAAALYHDGDVHGAAEILRIVKAAEAHRAPPPPLRAPPPPVALQAA